MTKIVQKRGKLICHANSAVSKKKIRMQSLIADNLFPIWRRRRRREGKERTPFFKMCFVTFELVVLQYVCGLPGCLERCLSIDELQWKKSTTSEQNIEGFPSQLNRWLHLTQLGLKKAWMEKMIVWVPFGEMIQNCVRT